MSLLKNRPARSILFIITLLVLTAFSDVGLVDWSV